MQVTRTFTHRTNGKFGTVTLTCGETEWTLDGKPLPQASVEYLLRIALESLQVISAGTKSREEAEAAFNRKRRALLAGTIGARRTARLGYSRFIPQLMHNRLSPENKAKHDAMGSERRGMFLLSLFDKLSPTEQKQTEELARQAEEADLSAKEAARVGMKL